MAGVDVAYETPGPDGVVAGAVVVLDLADLSVVEVATAVRRAEFPYVPGQLAEREAPVLLDALRALRVRPSVLVCDGVGIAHPRRYGLACHMGEASGLASFGVAKTMFVGTHGPVGPERGDWADLVLDGEVVGRALRTRGGVKPVYVSVGHQIDLDTATDLILRLTPRFRLPETTRQADAACRAALRRSLPATAARRPDSARG
ncbi:endonuclease V [Allorhizocola rhizosphaerae]|uniref:endonuclease V n=1 Tax=Allorhizocola rhizosphaerae TaxID=1872709 RepID=UPI00248221AB|nr:endonuclease V [Allorhizocola rhizosphaerae]